MCIDTDTDIEISIYLSIHLKLGKAYRVIEAVIEAEKSQDMQSASGDPGQPSVVPIWVWKPENPESQWHKFQFGGEQAWGPRWTNLLNQVPRQEKTDVPA